MIPFRFTGQHDLVFDFGVVHPGDEFGVSLDRVESFRYRPDMECLDLAALDLAKPQAESAAETPIVTPKFNAKSDDSGKPQSKQE